MNIEVSKRGADTVVAHRTSAPSTKPQLGNLHKERGYLHMFFKQIYPKNVRREDERDWI